MNTDIETMLDQGLARLDQACTPGQRQRLLALVGELTHWNRRINLTAIRDPLAMVSGHILDSLAVRPWVRGPAILDIGTGAGFPGLPLAIAEPSMHFVLLDSNARKLSFVTHVAGELGLDNVDTVKARAEDYAPAIRFDTVTARALAAVPRLVELAAHLVGEDGQLLALKGRYPAAELESVQAAAEWDFDVQAVSVPGLEARSRHVVRLERSRNR